MEEGIPSISRSNFLIPNLEISIFRELYIKEVSIRPDAICLLKRNKEGLCFILEVAVNERESSLENKLNIWKSWGNSREFLSQLFKCHVPNFYFVISGEPVIDTAVDFKYFLEEVKNGV